MSDIPDWLKTDYDMEDEKAAAAAQEGGTSPHTVSTSQDDLENAAGGTTADGEENSSRKYGGFCKALLREWKVVLLALVILIGMNIPVVRWAFYPFVIFATWIHEMCHGFAGLFAGYDLQKLEVFVDTSGLATLGIDDDERWAFVASAGYQGTPVVGFLLLIFRRTKRGPRLGLWILGLLMLVSVALWIRNLFGIISVLIIGFFLLLCGWKLPSAWMRALYTVVAVTTSMNAIASVRALYGPTQTINGEDAISDAHAMAEMINGTSSWMWATIWLLLGILFTFLGIVFAIPGPNEQPNFRCCGMCVDCGLFYLCNATREKKDEQDQVTGEKESGIEVAGNMEMSDRRNVSE
eukprot:CAMPEP_0178763448 /NCGR_PEP_ID=MMETSP0744-20121128/17171_1 /TAXON_ID=913974 /ORGANISM="Nitzschia punctata, Strain CCMP561" /LENGTH=350 /DNA_ID=CAMNT_0020418373 /DNA_START=123 /DNA_END=1175 /DNA_ORIENTATION=-